MTSDWVISLMPIGKGLMLCTFSNFVTREVVLRIIRSSTEEMIYYITKNFYLEDKLLLVYNLTEEYDDSAWYA